MRPSLLCAVVPENYSLYPELVLAPRDSVELSAIPARYYSLFGVGTRGPVTGSALEGVSWQRQTCCMTSDEVLSRFVLRARRIAAHSLVLDRAELQSHASGLFTGTIDTTGKMTMVQELPDSEEAFESLAARLRPLTVRSEPIHFVKVFAALEAVQSAQYEDRITTLRDAWNATEIQGTQVHAFSVQQSKADGTEATDFISDTQLAAAWLYADLVHSEATGAKKAALVFPMAERYGAAVRIFAHMALLTLATLELVDSMADDGLIDLDPQARTADVVVGKGELVREARAYVAELGTTPPDLRMTRSWSDEWKPYTVTEMLRESPTNRVQVTLRMDNGETLAEYDAAIVRRSLESASREWHVLVGGCFVFEFGLDYEGDKFVGGRFDNLRVLSGSNELGWSASQLWLQMNQSAAVVFGVNDVQLFELTGFTLTLAEAREHEVHAEVLGDIVTIERLTGESYDECNSGFTDSHRVSLRRARLLHEAKLIRANRGSLIATRDIEQPPQSIMSAASTLEIGGATIPVPRTMLWHPEMTADFVETVEGKSSFKMAVPSGERFFEWAPDLLNLMPDSDFSDATAIAVSGISEDQIG